MAAANIDDYVEKILSKAPPLTDDQKTRLSELFRAARRPVPKVLSAGGAD
jgi:hypothetical protein